MTDPCSPETHFEVVNPLAHKIPFVFNSPHSGRNYTREFVGQSRLNELGIRRSEDHFADELFAAGIDLGAPMLKAHFPRAFLDVNREPYELDNRMFDGKLPPHVNSRSPRVAGGLGTIPRIVAENMEIYKTRLPVAEALDRIENIYKPYHACLRRLIAQTHVKFGQAILIDCHTMPGNIRIPCSHERPDFIIGDRYGTSASSYISQAAIEILRDLGFTVARNKPYAGGFITEHYGRPARNLHALQVEVSRGLYVNEKTLEKKPHFDELATLIGIFLDRLIDSIDYEDGLGALAAE